MSRRLVDLELHVYHATDGAFLVHTEDDARDAAVWVPKSQVEIEPEYGLPGTYVLTMPQSLAEEKGLV